MSSLNVKSTVPQSYERQVFMFGLATDTSRFGLPIVSTLRVAYCEKFLGLAKDTAAWFWILTAILLFCLRARLSHAA